MENFQVPESLKPGGRQRALTPGGGHGKGPGLISRKKTWGKRGEISENGGTEPYKTIFYGDIPLHRPKK